MNRNFYLRKRKKMKKKIILTSKIINKLYNIKVWRDLDESQFGKVLKKLKF